jgi:WD40 repeat protein
LLASASEDGNLIVWNVGDGFPMATVSKPHTPKAAPGQYGTIPGGVLSAQFAGDYQGKVMVWDGMKVMVLRGGTAGGASASR